MTVIETGQRGAVRVLTLAHGKVNALDVELLEALVAELDACAAAPPGALVLTGAGRAFSAGVDLHRVLDGGAPYTERLLTALDAALLGLFDAPYPVVCALNGHAIAGGYVLACAADHRVMAEGSGRVGVPELAVGVPWPTVALEVVRQALPPQCVQELVYLGETRAAADALALGLVDALAPADELLDRAVAVAERLAATPAAAYGSAKALLRGDARERIARLGPERAAEVRAGWAAPETVAAIRAYLDATLAKGR